MLNLPLNSDYAGARFDEDRIYRWLLWRRWEACSGTVLWVMLNPSTADETRLDPTLRRCFGFTREWGYGAMEVCNAYGLRSTNPTGLWEVDDPVGPDNDVTIVERSKLADLVVVGWGVNIEADREAEVSALLPEAMCLGVTKKGHPVHPLYQPRDAMLVPWRRT